MTNKETLVFIKETFEGFPANEQTAAALEYCEKALASLEKDRERNAERRAKKAEENAPLFEALEEILSAEPLTAADAAGKIGVSVQKASHLLRALVDAGKANVQDIKIPKKGSCKAYTKAIAE